MHNSSKELCFSALQTNKWIEYHMFTWSPEGSGMCCIPGSLIPKLGNLILLYTHQWESPKLRLPSDMNATNWCTRIRQGGAPVKRAALWLFFMKGCCFPIQNHLRVKDRVWLLANSLPNGNLVKIKSLQPVFLYFSSEKKMGHFQ